MKDESEKGRRGNFCPFLRDQRRRDIKALTQIPAADQGRNSPSPLPLKI